MTDETVMIRRVRGDDDSRLRSVRLRALETDPLSYGSGVEEAMQRGPQYWSDWAVAHAQGVDHCTLIALIGDEPIGLVRAEREDGDVFGVYSMWVAPEVRRRGVAMALLAAIEDWIRSAGGREAQLFVVESVAPARGLYERAGYVLDGRLEPADRPGMTELGMRKAL